MIINLVDKAVESGARQKKAAAIMGISARTIIRWRQQSAGSGQDQRKGPLTTPANKLSEKERQQVLDITDKMREKIDTLEGRKIYGKRIGIRFFSGSKSTL
jgi:transposase